MTALLEIRDLHVAYGKVEAVRGVGLTMQPGQIVTVIGPNGAGKTTLMRVISGLLMPSAGEIALSGMPITALPAYRIVAAGIAHVPENRRLFPRLTVEENLRMGAYIPAARRQLGERLAWVYELFPRLSERRRQLAGTLSGGEQQRCAIGRALMSRPKLLLMDEPSAGLAPLAVEQVFALVRRIRAEGFTVLIVEQNVQQVLELVDRAYLLEAGHIRLSGSAAELRRNEAIRKAYVGL
jgi:branched-chain amino acid transport system ATP-binding protein